MNEFEEPDLTVRLRDMAGDADAIARLEEKIGIYRLTERGMRMKKRTKKVDWEAVYFDIVNTGAELARSKMSRLACSGICEPMTLHYKPQANGVNGELQVFRAGELPAGNEGGWIATDRVLQPNVSYMHYFEWFRKNSGDLPILGNYIDDSLRFRRADREPGSATRESELSFQRRVARDLRP